MQMQQSHARQTLRPRRRVKTQSLAGMGRREADDRRGNTAKQSVHLHGHRSPRRVRCHSPCAGLAAVIRLVAQIADPPLRPIRRARRARRVRPRARRLRPRDGGLVPRARRARGSPRSNSTPRARVPGRRWGEAAPGARGQRRFQPAPGTAKRRVSFRTRCRHRAATRRNHGSVGAVVAARERRLQHPGRARAALPCDSSPCESLGAKPLACRGALPAWGSMSMRPIGAQSPNPDHILREVHREG